MFGPNHESLAFATHGNDDVKCQRYGRTTHSTEDCYTKSHEDGHALPPVGKTLVTTDNSAAKTDSAQPPTNAEGKLCVTTGTASPAPNDAEWDWYESGGFQFAQTNVSLTTYEDKLPSSWILLDNQSTVHVFNNRRMFCKLCTVKTTMTIRCNAGTKTTNQQGLLPGFGWVWYLPEGIANIFSLSKIAAKYRVTFDSSASPCFIVHKPDGSTRVFQQHSSGLYYLDASKSTGVALINTVDNNKTKYSKKDYLCAKAARRLQNILGLPSTATFLEIADKKRLLNSKVTHCDIVIAEEIFGPNVAALKGKTVRKTPNTVTIHMTPLPPHIADHYTNITLCIDIMFVNKIPFLTTISRHINFRTVGLLRSQQAKNITNELIKILALYRQHGFRVEMIMANNEFWTIKPFLADKGISINVASADEHVPDVERSIRVIKERARGIFNALPFQRIPSVMLSELICLCVFWLNFFPLDHGVCGVISPRTLLMGLEVDYNKHCHLCRG